MNLIINEFIKDNRCKKCNKQRGDHKAKTLECPTGTRTRIGYLDYVPNQVFEPKKKRIKKSKNESK